METEIFITPRPYRVQKLKSTTLAEESIRKIIAERTMTLNSSTSSSQKEIIPEVKPIVRPGSRSPSPKAVVTPVSVMGSHALRVMKVSSTAHKRKEVKPEDEKDGKYELIDSNAINKLVTLIERKRKLLKAATDGDLALLESLEKEDDMNFMNFVYRPSPKSQWNLKTPREYLDTIMSKIECPLPRADIRPTNFKLELEKALLKARQLPYRKLDLVRRRDEQKNGLKGKSEWETLLFMEDKLADWQAIRRQSIFKTRTRMKPKTYGFSHPTIYSSKTDFINSQSERIPSPLQQVPSLDLMELKPVDEIIEKNKKLAKRINGGKNEFNPSKRKSVMEHKRRTSRAKSKSRRSFLKELIDLTQAYDVKEYEPIDFLKKEEDIDKRMISRLQDNLSFSDARGLKVRRKSVAKTDSKITKEESFHKPKYKMQRKSRIQSTATKPKPKSRKRDKKGKFYSWNFSEGSVLSRLGEPESKDSIVSDRSDKRARKFDSKAMVSKYKDFISNYEKIVAKRKKEAEELDQQMDAEKNPKPKPVEDPNQGEWLSRPSFLQSWTYDAEYEKKKKLLESSSTINPEEQKTRLLSTTPEVVLSAGKETPRSSSFLYSRGTSHAGSMPSVQDYPRFHAPSITDAHKLSKTILPSLRSEISKTSKL